MITDPELRLVADVRCAIGENPQWNVEEQRLYWVDIPRGNLYRYDPTTGSHEIVRQGPLASGFTFQHDGSMILFGVGGAVSWLRDGSETVLHAGLPGEEQHRFNDVIADPLGRVLAGTVAYTAPKQSGRLYAFDPDGGVRMLRDDVELSNGLGFSLDHRTLYHADSEAHTVMQFDYDVSDGAITNARLFASVPKTVGFPDGLTVDTDGCIWLAVWDGYRLIRYTPDGRIDREIHFPTRKVSSVIFGGADLRDAYVTTAGGDKVEENGPTAGGLYQLRPGAQGLPEFLSRLPAERKDT